MRRDATVICVVEEPGDIIPVERTHEFQGRYHVLGGALSPIDGIDPSDLKIEELYRRVASGAETRRVRLPLEAFIWNTRTRKPMRRAPWAFTRPRRVSIDGKEVYSVIYKKIIASIKIEPTALLNTPMDTASLCDDDPRAEGVWYVINRALAPEVGTKCTLILEPWTGKERTFTDRPSGDVEGE